MSVLSAVLRSPVRVYDINDYPGLRQGTVHVTRWELKLADAGDEMMQDVICDRYAHYIGREGAPISWGLMRKHMVFVTVLARPSHGVAGMVLKVKMVTARMTSNV